MAHRTTKLSKSAGRWLVARLKGSCQTRLVFWDKGRSGVAHPTSANLLAFSFFSPFQILNTSQELKDTDLGYLEVRLFLDRPGLSRGGAVSGQTWAI